MPARPLFNRGSLLSFVREIGKNLYAWSFGPAVRVDKDDNIWAVDKGSDMVIKFNPEGKVVRVFGRKQEASDEDTGPVKHPKPPLPAEDGRFRQVIDVTWDPAGNDAQGNIDVADRFNRCIQVFDSDGNFLRAMTIDVPFDRNTRPAIGNKLDPDATKGT